MMLLSIILLLSHLLTSAVCDVNYKEKCNDGDNLALTGECIWYKQCVDGEYKAQFKCPKKEFIHPNGTVSWSNQFMFDPESRKCVEKFKVAVPGECQSYKECLLDDSVSLFEKWTLFKCESGRHFDPDTKKCIDSSLSKCGRLINC